MRAGWTSDIGVSLEGMGKLEEQLKRAERASAPRKEKPNGGPVSGGPSDRWIGHHSTLGTRSAVVLITVLSIGLFGVGAVMAWMSDHRFAAAMLGAAAAIPIVIAWAVYLVRQARAPEKEREYLRSLPFQLTGYLETMRQPKWWKRWSYAVVYEPKLAVTWVEHPGAPTIEKLATLAKAKFYNGVFESTNSTVTDPWKWTRGVVSEVLMPLREKSEVASAELTVKRAVEYVSSD